MRSAESQARTARTGYGLAAPALAGLMVLLAACSTRPPVTDASVQPTPAAAPVPAAGPAAAASAQPAPTDAASRAAFDAALQAMRKGRREEAERALRSLSQAHPELGGAQANLGLLERRAGRLPEALAAFEQAVKDDPAQPRYHNQLGITLRQLGRFAEARQAYERALALDPAYADAALNLGVLLDLYLGDAAGALARYQRYLELTPAGDPLVAKWVVEIGQRKAPAVAVNKEAK